MPAVSSCRCQAASALGRRTASRLLGVERLDRCRRRATPAAWTTAVSGCSAGIAASSAASAARSATSQAATSTSAPSSASSATSSAAPGRRGRGGWSAAGGGRRGRRQVPGDEGAEAAGAAGDQDGALGVEPASAGLGRGAAARRRATRRGTAGRALAQGELRLLGLGQRRGSAASEASVAVAVDQREAAGVLGLGGADQAPDGGGGGSGALARRRRATAPAGDEGEPAGPLGGDRGLQAAPAPRRRGRWRRPPPGRGPGRRRSGAISSLALAAVPVCGELAARSTRARRGRPGAPRRCRAGPGRTRGRRGSRRWTTARPSASAAVERELLAVLGEPDPQRGRPRPRGGRRRSRRRAAAPPRSRPRGRRACRAASSSAGWTP